MRISRRKFLIGLAAAGGTLALSRPSLPFFGEQDFELLVIGDSLIAGQGLIEKDRSYNLFKDWLETEFFKGKRNVNLMNHSHSGASLFLAEREIEGLKKGNRDPKKAYHKEVNFSFPSISAQVEIAADEYKAKGLDAIDVDMVLMSGSLTDITSKKILDAFDRYGPLHKLIEKHCYEGMFRFLETATNVFPSAVFTIVSYFPMVSKKSSSGEIYNAVLELYDYPGFTKPILNNIVTKQFFKILHNRLNKRSRIFYEESSEAIKKAIKRINEKNGRLSAVFVESPIPVDRSFETKDSLLWGMGKKGRADDDMYDIRVEECGKAFKDIEDLDLPYGKRFCELSGIGHPNPEGARLYAEAIANKIKELSQKGVFRVPQT
ncbi:MAG: twin-arginine translocation signal domain-containing protein [Pyrinomonadaceae bacterium]|nr:twin-arginine translocation signal domain-containing protein [Pyrinomonadaceae bacterium]